MTAATAERAADVFRALDDLLTAARRTAERSWAAGYASGAARHAADCCEQDWPDGLAALADRIRIEVRWVTGKREA